MSVPQVDRPPPVHVDPDTGFGANDALLEATNRGVLHGGVRAALAMAALALAAIAAGALFELLRPALGLGRLPPSVAPRVDTSWATSPPQRPPSG
jgi:hypothetical protein